ncbi:MAG TPA: endolytic transglycosylase MltG [Candidatus Saccharimonadia bacterium]|jgi:UPF0755 protein
MKKPYRRWVPGALITLILLLVPLSYIIYRLDLRPLAKTGSTKEFRVMPGENAPSIATRLKAAGLIRDRNAFVTYINFHGLRPHLKLGTYLLAPTMSANLIAEDIAGGKTLTKRLVVPEGYRLSQIEAEAVSSGMNQQAFEAALAAPHGQSFLAGKPAGVDLEGYLFPDSYSVDTATTPAELVNAMLDNFGARVGAEYVQAFAAEGLTLHQGLTIASIVEREVNIPEDRPIVAQIFITRLHTGMPLGSEVTARYAASLLGVPFTTTVDSPYNTLTHTGLPPGPICSPGLSALDAVAHPATTNYLYFITGADHKDYFAHTYAEHQANIAKYGLVGS